MRARTPRTAPVAALLGLLAGCGQGQGGGGDRSARPEVPVVEVPAAPDDPLAEIEGYVLGLGETLDVIEKRDERGELVLRRGVLRDSDGMVNHGHFQRWHPNGQIAEDGHYLRGARHGRYTVVADSGLKQSEVEYRHGVKHGESLTWHERGVLKERAHFVEGVLDGAYESREGATLVHGTYDHGVEVGPWTWTDLKGNLVREGTFEAGVRVGLWRTWHADEVLATEEHYVDGVLEGQVVEYDAQGARTAERSYVAGQLQGESREFHPDGTPSAVISYVAGVPQGPQTRWYADGVVQMQGSMEQGKRSGAWVYNKPDGTRNEAWSGTYEADVRVGD